mmetsp:Transcript_2218/g.6145  ORF Transcript_2218/g.6145 Transcript_2218/m.6145 type:complete len:235 (-) Transcript_2218:422-1126(-)
MCYIESTPASPAYSSPPDPAVPSSAATTDSFSEWSPSFSENSSLVASPAVASSVASTVGGASSLASSVFAGTSSDSFVRLEPLFFFVGSVFRLKGLIMERFFLGLGISVLLLALVGGAGDSPLASALASLFFSFFSLASFSLAAFFSALAFFFSSFSLRRFFSASDSENPLARNNSRSLQDWVLVSSISKCPRMSCAAAFSFSSTSSSCTSSMSDTMLSNPSSSAPTAEGPFLR